MIKTIQIEVCDYPGCGNAKGLVACYHCGMRVCSAHRFEGEKGGRQQFLCWMGLPAAMGLPIA